MFTYLLTYLFTKLKFKGQSVQTIEWKQTDRQTDATDCFTFPANAIGNKYR